MLMKERTEGGKKCLRGDMNCLSGLKGGIGVLGTAKDLVRLERNSGRLVGVVMVWYSLNRGWGKVG